MTSNSLFSLPTQRQAQQQQSNAQRTEQLHHHHHQHGRLTSKTGSASAYDAVAMQQQMELFVRDGIDESAQLLGEFLISIANAAASGGGSGAAGEGGAGGGSALLLSREFHGKSFSLFADLLMRKREYKRAIQYYKRSWKIQIGSSTNANASTSAEAVAIKVRIAQCWIALDGAHQAIDVLSSVLAPHRTLVANLLLGKLYLGESLKNKAEEAYRAALRRNPYALEAALALAEITATRESAAVVTSSSSSSSSSAAAQATQGGSVTDPAFWQREVEHFHAASAETLTAPTAPTAPPGSSEKKVGDAGWLHTLTNAHIHANRGRYRSAMDCFDALDRTFPHNLHALLSKGKLEMDQEFYHQAHLNFHRARQIDDQNLHLMDAHADCLRKNGAKIQLNTLVQDLFETSDTHAQCWLAASYLSEMKGELEMALQFAERAIVAKGSHAAAHLFRGSLLLQLHKPEQALVAFTTACQIQKTLEAYSGIITSYCDLCTLKGINKYKEALICAKTLVKLYPQKAHSYTLLGNVFALRVENKDHAKRAFQRALSIEPRKLQAVFGWVDLLVRDGCFAQAVDKLMALAEQCPREEVFTKLADVSTLNKQFGEALTFYHRALSVNPGSQEASRGLERLEKIMRGEDPDELNSTMEHLEEEDGDEQDDSMDAGEYVTS